MYPCMKQLRHNTILTGGGDFSPPLAVIYTTSTLRCMRAVEKGFMLIYQLQYCSILVATNNSFDGSE